MKVKNCEECNKEFEYEPPKGFPDKRKYCRVCSEKKKQQWDERDAPIQKPGTASGEWETPGYPKMIEADKNEQLGTTIPKGNGKEYHLSPEEVKCRALECAIESWQGIFDGKATPEAITALADKFVKWIYA